MSGLLSVPRQGRPDPESSVNPVTMKSISCIFLTVRSYLDRQGPAAKLPTAERGYVIRKIILP
jgi:hypothetical protein